jgi:MoaA/NifB/PqqE/SkfB family radical SAM enzyme
MIWMQMKSRLPVVLGQDKYPAFTRVSLETTGWCNRQCSFCPAHKRRRGTTMSDDLYTSLCRQLAGFEGVVQWFFLNEPLLDKARHARIALLRAWAPRATIHVTSNWDVVWGCPDNGYGEIDALFEAGVNSLNLNDYDGKGYHLLVDAYCRDNGMRRVKHSWKRGLSRRLSCGPLPTQLHAWGTAANRPGYCARPHRHIVICWNGLVPLCCAVDVATCEWLGDANKETLAEIWQDPCLWAYRWHLQHARRQGDCTGCDETMAFPHVVRRVEL